LQASRYITNAEFIPHNLKDIEVKLDQKLEVWRTSTRVWVGSGLVAATSKAHPRAAARSVLEVSAGWVSLSSSGLLGWRRAGNRNPSRGLFAGVDDGGYAADRARRLPF
jgi:hypothetical protein